MRFWATPSHFGLCFILNIRRKYLLRLSSEVEFDMGHIVGHMSNKVSSQKILRHLLRNKGGNAMPQINLSAKLSLSSWWQIFRVLSPGGSVSLFNGTDC